MMNILAKEYKMLIQGPNEEPIGTEGLPIEQLAERVVSLYAPSRVKGIKILGMEFKDEESTQK